MTHGDKAKAKTGKGSSQTSGKKSGKGIEAKGAGKDGKGTKGEQASAKQTVAEKPVSKKDGGTSAKEPSGAERGKSRVPAGDGSGFSNASVGAAFKHALKKYPNAFRKLTD
jgi:hypothetical protein